MQNQIQGLNPLSSVGAGMVSARTTDPAADFTAIFISEILKQHFKTQAEFTGSPTSIFSEVLLKQVALNLAREDVFGFKDLVRQGMYAAQK